LQTKTSITTAPDSLGSRIRVARTGRGWSLAEVARRTGLSRAYINAIENGRSSRPGAETIVRLEEALGPLVVRGRETLIEVPPGLKSLAKSQSLSTGEIQILAGLRVRGYQPQTEERWRFIYDALVASESLDSGSRRRSRRERA
jgi:transcriptional regulator with XRE-family HTH domain